MSALRTFLIGLATRNLGAKFLALMLAIILFVVVHSQNEGRWTLDELRISFALETGLEESFVLLDDELRLNDLVIQGPRARVDTPANALQRSKQVAYTLTRRMLDRHATKRRIDLTRAVLEDILAVDQLRVVNPPEKLSIRFQPLVRRSMTVTFAGQEERLKLSKENRYRSASGDPMVVDDLRFDCPAAITVIGPEIAFANSEPGSLFLRLPDLDAYLNTLDSDEEEFEARVPIAGIEWAQSGLDPAYLDFVRVVADRSAPAEHFAATIHALFRVREVQDSATPELRIRIMQDPARSVDLEKWSSAGLVVPKLEFDARKAKVPIQFPRSLAGTRWSEKLVLVYDLARATRTEDELRVPVYLFPADSPRKEDLGLLSRVLLSTDAKEESFNRRQP